MYANINGKLVPIEKAAVSIYDHGLLYGYGLFITVRAYKGHLFLIDDHLDKLRKGLDDLGIEVPASMKTIEANILETMKANNRGSGAVRVTVTAGKDGWMTSRSPYAKPNLIIFTRKLTSRMDSPSKRITVLNTPYDSPKVPYKMISRANYILAMKEIRGKRVNEGLFLTRDGFVAEGISSNVFVVLNGIILTPPASAGIITGVTRSFVMRLANKAGYDVREEPIEMKMLRKADEIFLTCSSQQISQVVCIDDWYQSSNHTVTADLQKLYMHYTSTLRSANQL